MAVTQLNTTTVTNAITASDYDFAVGATTNITVGSLLVAAGTGAIEIMRVQAIPVAGRVQVMRGVVGTVAKPQAASTLLYLGTPDQFKSIRDSAAAIVGDSVALPDYLTPGARAHDGSGNEYVLVDLTFPAFVGAVILISRDGLFTASALTAAAPGSVGVLVEEGTSNQYAWAQIYGANAHCQLVSGSSLVTSTGVLTPATSVSTPAVGVLGLTTSQASSVETSRVYGMYPTSAASTATTSATSATGLFCSVWLNYPFTLRQVSS